MAIAAACSPSAADAIRKGLEELAHTRRHAVELKSEAFVPAVDYLNVVDQNTHVRLFTERAQRELADFLFASDAWMEASDLPSVAGSQPEEQLQNLTVAIQTIGHQILIKDVTTPDIQSLGLFVARAIIPGFHPLFMGHGNRALGGIRLWTIPQSLGYRGISSSDNPAPHPFP
jgi:ribosomal protein S12 methylthiotransferase accessory factor